MMQEQKQKEQRIGQNFIIKKRLGSGAFGEIYLGVNVKNNIEVAIKIEPLNSPCPQLKYEHEIYKRLLSDKNVIERGLPHVYYTSVEGDYTYMVMDLLGQSLEEIFISRKRKFSIKTVIMIALQLIDRIEYVHSKGVLHRDIKPDNFLVGRDARINKIYIVDFGLAKRYEKDGRHIQYKESKTLTGTARYASLNTHLGVEQSRRDDIECMAYVLFYFLKGSLPWQNMRARNKREKYERIMEKKMTTTYDELTKGVPKEFGQLLKYSRNLEFEDKIDYIYLKKLMLDAADREGINIDNVFDWCLMKSSQQ